jgi:hypothetical protein
LRFFSFLIIILLLFITGCEDEPTATGIDLVNQSDLLSRDTIDSFNDGLSQKFSSFVVPEEISYLNAGRNIIGRVVDETTTEAEAVLVMRLFAEINTSDFEYLNDSTLEVLESKFILKPKYTLGNDDQPFDIDVHPLIKNWDVASGVKKADLDTLYDASVNLKESYISKVDDSLLTFSVNKQVMKDWIYSRIKGPDSTYQYKGVAFIPSPGTRKVIGFNTSNLEDMPKIEVVVSKGAAAEIDTLIFTPYYSYAIQHVVIKGVLAADNQDLVIQAGIPVRSFLHFDLSGISPDVILNKAELILTIDTLKSIETSEGISNIYVDALKDSTDKTSGSTSITYSVMSRSGNTFKGTVTNTIQGQIQRGLDEGYLLSSLSEKQSLSREVFYSSTYPDKSKRPRLIIYYTKKK